MLLKIWDVSEDCDVERSNGTVWKTVYTGQTYEEFVSCLDYDEIFLSLVYFRNNGGFYFHEYEIYALEYDPDETYGRNLYIPTGTFWLNRTSQRLWQCMDNGTGNDDAVWHSHEHILSGTQEPATNVTGYHGDKYHKTDTNDWYFCNSDPSGTSWTKLT
jgi:hypothetical protein